MSLGKIGEDEGAVDEMYDTAAEILSNNMQKKHFAADEVENMFDTEELGALFEEYSEFVSGIKSDPN